MRPYAVEGLDCSGKKTLARLVQRRLADAGCEVPMVIGPLIGGGLGRVDARLANITSTVRRGTLTDLARRCVYVAEPVLDGIAYHRLQPALKVSTHFRAWARAEVEADHRMAAAFAATTRLQVRYVGATLLATDFSTRVERHRADVAAGRTNKVEERRFFGPDPAKFARWHATLDTLMDTHIPSLLRVDTTSAPLDELAEQITTHVVRAWNQHGQGCLSRASRYSSSGPSQT